jgi:hypothetical protein
VLQPTTSPDNIGEDLFNRYAMSTQGLHHATQPLRYECGFGSYGRARMLTDLGDDLDPVKHMPVTEQTLRDLITAERPHGYWSPSDVRVGRTAAYLHDIGECTEPTLLAACGAVVGDIAEGRKTDGHREIEAGVRAYLYRQHFPDISDAFLGRVEKIIAHREATPMHHALEAAHDINSLRVGLRAGRIVFDRPGIAPCGPESIRLEQLRRMAVSVTGAVLCRLERHASSFKYAAEVLENAGPICNYIQTELK